MAQQPFPADKNIIEAESRQAMMEEEKNIDVLYEERVKALEEHPDVTRIAMDKVAVWRCPCSKIMAGPYTFFRHVKEDHRDDDLQDLHTRATIKRVQERDHQLNVIDFAILENAEDCNFARRVKQVASECQFPSSAPSYLSKPITLDRQKHDWAMYLFYNESAGGCDQSKKAVMALFDLIRNYLGGERQEGWLQEPVHSVPLMFQELLAVVREKGGWMGLGVVQLRELLFTYCKWLLFHNYTTHRILKQPQEYPERVEGDTVKIQEEWQPRPTVKLEHQSHPKQ